MPPRNLTQQINHTENNDHFENLLFDVRKVKMKLDHQDDLFVTNIHDRPVTAYKAVVNLENKEVLSVVSNDYDLIPNREAFKKGKALFSNLTGIDGTDLRPFKVIASKRRTFCHVDFVHTKYNPIQFKQDSWLPFLRVTNSYNKTHLLRYQIGFVRTLCANGMLFDEESIVLKRSHSSGDSDFVIEAEVKPERFRKLQNHFMNSLEGLFKFNVPEKYVLPLCYQVLGITFQTKNPIKAIREKAMYQEEKFEAKVKELTDFYYKQLDHTAYAVLNILTDLISHERYDIIQNFVGREAGFQHRIYRWAREFPEEVTKATFSWDTYLKQNVNV